MTLSLLPNYPISTLPPAQAVSRTLRPTPRYQPSFKGQDALRPQKISLRARVMNWMLQKAGVCFFYGTFNPVHLAHIDNALAAQKMGFKHVFFIPNKNPPHKLHNKDLLPYEQRLEMLRLGLKGLPGMHVLSIDKATKATGETQIPKWVKYLFPAGLKIPCIVGDDALQGMNDKYNNPFLLERMLFLQKVRGEGAQLVTELKYNGKTYPVNTLPLKVENERSISSTLVRDHVRKGLPIDELVPPAVKAYIEQHGLYRDDQVQPQ